MTAPRPVPPVLLAVLLVLCAACGAGGGASGPPPSPAQVVRDAYGATAAAGGSQVTLAGRTSAAGQTVELDGDGGLDVAAGTADLTVRTASLGPAGVRTLFVGGEVYVALPPTLSSFVPGAKPYVSLDLDRVTARRLGGLGGLAGGGVANPARQLGYLQGLRDDARVVGPETIDGTPSTHYAGVVDLDRVPGAQDPATRPALDRLREQLGTASLPVDVWVDGTGRLRRVTQTVSPPAAPGGVATTSTTTLTFTRVGVPVTVAAPPPDQVTDVGRLLPGG